MSWTIPQCWLSSTANQIRRLEQILHHRACMPLCHSKFPKCVVDSWHTDTRAPISHNRHWNQLRRSGQPTDPRCSATSWNSARRGRAHSGMGILLIHSWSYPALISTHLHSMRHNKSLNHLISLPYRIAGSHKQFSSELQRFPRLFCNPLSAAPETQLALIMVGAQPWLTYKQISVVFC